VRGVGEEAPQLLFCRGALREGHLDLLEHRVEAEAEPAYFRAWLGRRHSLRQVAGGDLTGRVGHRLEGSQIVFDEQPGGHREAGQYEREHEDFDAEQASHGLRRLGERHGDDEDALPLWHILDQDAKGGAVASGGTGVEEGPSGDLDRRPGKRRGKPRRRLSVAAVGERDLVEDVALRVSQLPIGARRQAGLARAVGLVGESGYLGAGQLQSDRAARLAQLLVDALEQERAQRRVRHEAGDQQPGRHEAEQRQKQPRAQAHGQSRGARMQ